MDRDHSSTGSRSSSGESQGNLSDSFETPEAVEEAISLFQEGPVAAYAKRTVALFALIGLGLGLGGYLTITLMLEGGGLIDVTIGYLLAIVVLLFVTLLGAALAAVITTEAQTALDRPLVETCLICGISCYAGVLAMTVLSNVLIRGAFPPAVSAEFGTPSLVGLSILTSIPAALIAVGVVWIDRQYFGKISRLAE